MDDTNGGLLITSRSIQHPPSPDEHPQNMPAGARSSTLANVTDGSEDDISGEERQSDRTCSPQTMLQDKPMSERRKRSHTRLGGDGHEEGESNVGGERDVLATRAQHDSFGDDEEYAEEQHDSVFAQHRKSLLLSRLLETYPNGRLTMINLSRRCLIAGDALLLADAIVRNPMLSVLKLSYNDLGDEGVSHIAAAIKNDGNHHANLSVLDLGFNSIGDIGCQSIAEKCVAGNFTLQTLFLAGNCIKRKGTLSIAEAILHGSGLKRLHLTANRIGPIGLKALAGAIAKHDERAAAQTRVSTTPVPSVQELYIGSIGVKSDGFIAVPSMLMSNVSLRCISIAGSGVGDHEMQMFSQALSQNKSLPLEKLVFSFNEITCQGVECLMNAVWGSKSLRVVRLDNNRIQDRGAQLCAVALTSIAMEVLDLSFNRLISTTGIKALMKNISENSSLRSLGLAGIHLDQNSSKALSYALAYNMSLQTLYLDNCNVGYASQRHIVAGIVSNQRASLRLVTGFDIAPIAMTLGLPRLPESWSNDQILGFIRYMWQQWLLKSGRGKANSCNEIRGPAPPAAVASASKIAFSSLSSDAGELFQTELHEKLPSEQPPMDRITDALLERTDSGTIGIPSFCDVDEEDLKEWTGDRVRTGQASSYSMVRTALEDPERRNRNLAWLRSHFRALNDIGRLPFNNADLWQLHQYYFSPPYSDTDDDENKGKDNEPTYAARKPAAAGNARLPVSDNSSLNSRPASRTISFQTLGDAIASSTGTYKRRCSENEEGGEDDKPSAKRAKNFRTRIAYYPRITAKVQELGTRPMEHTLSLLRRLKYAENIMFADRNPYDDQQLKNQDPSQPSHADVEMVLLDLL